MVFLDFLERAGAFVCRIASVATGAGIHGSDEHKIGGISGFLVGTRDGNMLVF